MVRNILFFILLLISSYFIMESTFIKSVQFSIIVWIIVIFVNFFDKRKSRD
jgi:hypothetical protein